MKYFMCDDIDLWIEFFGICKELKVSEDNVEKREEIILELMEKRKFKGCTVVNYNKTKEQIKEHLQSVWGNVLDLSSTEKVQRFQKEFEASKWKNWTDEKEKK